LDQQEHGGGRPRLRRTGDRVGNRADTRIAQNLSRIVDDVISQFKGSLEIWPTLVEICYLQKNRAGLPKRVVANQRPGR
jgi:hypothetical protein